MSSSSLSSLNSFGTNSTVSSTRDYMSRVIQEEFTKEYPYKLTDSQALECLDIYGHYFGMDYLESSACAFAVSKVIDEQSDENRTVYINTYVNLRLGGNSNHYSRAAAILIAYYELDRDQVRTFARIYESILLKEGRGKDQDYAFALSSSLVFHKKSLKKAGKYAESYFNKIEDGKSKEYADAFARSVVYDGFNVDLASRYAHAYEEAFNSREGKEVYALGYASSFVYLKLDSVKAKSFARVFQNRIYEKILVEERQSLQEQETSICNGQRIREINLAIKNKNISILGNRIPFVQIKESDKHYMFALESQGRGVDSYSLNLYVRSYVQKRAEESSLIEAHQFAKHAMSMRKDLLLAVS
jgi:hypothetical protein